jgi:serine/threonine-protein kinase ATR
MSVKLSLYLDAKAKEDGEGRLRSGSDKSPRSSSVHVVSAMQYLGKSLRYGHKNIGKSLPKLLTLWLSFTDQKDSVTDNSKSPLHAAIQSANDVIEHMLSATHINASVFYFCISQLVARIGHSNARTVSLLKKILVRLLIDFPRQSIWHVIGMIHSQDKERKSAGKTMVNEAINQLAAANRRTDRDVLMKAEELSSQLIQLAQYQQVERSVKLIAWSAAAKISAPNVSNFLVPSQTNLAMVLLSSNTTAIQGGSSFFAENQESILSFSANVDVLSSKARPKIIKMTTSYGRETRMLLKQEKDGDLRKDARVMELASVVCRLSYIFLSAFIMILG